MAANFFFDAIGAFKKLETAKKAISKDVENALQDALTDARDEIIERTQGGQDVSGKAFVRYTDEYAAFKSGFTTGGKRRTVAIKSGKRKGKRRSVPINFGAGGKVNLTYTGSMLRSIQVKVTRKGKELIGSLFFPLREHGKVRGNQKLRKFFELSKEQLDTITKKIEAAINGRR